MESVVAQVNEIASDRKSDKTLELLKHQQIVSAVQNVAADVSSLRDIVAQLSGALVNAGLQLLEHLQFLSSQYPNHSPSTA